MLQKWIHYSSRKASSLDRTESVCGSPLDQEICRLCNELATTRGGICFKQQRRCDMNAMGATLRGWMLSISPLRHKCMLEQYRQLADLISIPFVYVFVHHFFTFWLYFTVWGLTMAVKRQKKNSCRASEHKHAPKISPNPVPSDRSSVWNDTDWKKKKKMYETVKNYMCYLRWQINQGCILPVMLEFGTNRSSVSERK